MEILRWALSQNGPAPLEISSFCDLLFCDFFSTGVRNHYDTVTDEDVAADDRTVDEFDAVSARPNAPA